MRDDDFIKSLTTALEPKTSLKSSQFALLSWMLLSFSFLVAGIIVLRVRDDVRPLLETLSFHLELFSALSLSIALAGAALHLRIPGARLPKKTLGGFLGFWIFSVFYHSLLIKTSPDFLLKSSLACMQSVILLSLLPGLVLFHFVRLGTTTQPKETMATIGMAMAAAAAAFLPLVCSNDGFTHQIIGHVSPVFLLGLLFWFAGQKLLKW